MQKRKTQEKMIFGNRFRFFKIIVSIALLVSLIFYGEVQGPKQIPGLKEFKNSPNLFINKELEFNGSLQKIGPNNFILNQKLDGEIMQIEIAGNLEKAKINDTIYAVAVYRADKKLLLDRYLISNSRPIKIAISFIAFLGVIFIFLKGFYFDFKNFIFRQR